MTLSLLIIQYLPIFQLKLEQFDEIMKKRKIDDEEYHRSRMETALAEKENAKIKQQILLEELKRKTNIIGTYLLQIAFSFILDDFLNWSKPNELLNFEKS